MTNNSLGSINDIFKKNGFSLWFVGGMVRDQLAGIPCKDIDLATDATPEEQLRIYRDNNIQYVETGIQHGTITIIVDSVPYEITTLRIDTNQDGRHSDVCFTTSINEDLSRRDLTINAMAMDFDGNLIDPFGGQHDLKTNTVRFVGDAKTRMKEDYLRILRYFRFNARFGNGQIDPETRNGLIASRGGLRNISVERIWSEIKGIVSGPAPVMTFSHMNYFMIDEIIRLPSGNPNSLNHAKNANISNPSSLMGFYLDGSEIEELAKAWKWSKNEEKRAMFVSSQKLTKHNGKSLFGLRVDGHPDDWVLDIAKYNGITTTGIMDRDLPVFPVNGNDLMSKGIMGKDIGTVMTFLKSEWKMSEYTLTFDDLISKV